MFDMINHRYVALRWDELSVNLDGRDVVRFGVKSSLEMRLAAITEVALTGSRRAECNAANGGRSFVSPPVLAYVCLEEVSERAVA
jgi:hypothetical protein